MNNGWLELCTHLTLQTLHLQTSLLYKHLFPEENTDYEESGNSMCSTRTQQRVSSLKTKLCLDIMFACVCPRNKVRQKHIYSSRYSRRWMAAFEKLCVKWPYPLTQSFTSALLQVLSPCSLSKRCGEGKLIYNTRLIRERLSAFKLSDWSAVFTGDYVQKGRTASWDNWINTLITSVLANSQRATAAPHSLNNARNSMSARVSSMRHPYWFHISLWRLTVLISCQWQSPAAS